nr:hypothetical protein [Tanacetum cinerariifolium]
MSLPIIVKATWTMATTIEQQVALDEALVPSTKRLRIGRSNFRLPSDIQSKESTLQVVYDVLRSCPFFKAFLVTSDHIVNLETFRDMLHICPRIPGQSFDELSFEEEILEFLRFLGHSAQIKTLTDVNINKLFQTWRSFGAVINKCLTGKSSGFDSSRLSQAQILNTKAYKEYYACATGEAVPKPKASVKRKRSGLDTSIPPPTAITTTTTTGAVTPRLTAAAKGKQPAKAKSPSDPSEHDDEGDEKDESDDGKEDDDNDKDGDERDDDDDEEEIAKIDVHDDTERGGDDDEESENDAESNDEETREEESFDPIFINPKDIEDDGNDEEDQGFKDGEDEWLNEQEEADELYRDVDINQGRGLQISQDIKDSHVTLTSVKPNGQQESSSVLSQFVTSMLNLTSDVGMESIFVTASSSVAPLPTPTPTMTPSIITTITTASHPPIPPTPIPSEVLQNLPTFDSVFCFDQRLKSLEANFSEYRQTNPFAEAVSNFLGIVHQYMNQQMNEAVKSQVKDQVLRILPRIKQSVNAQLKSKVLTKSSHSSRTSYAVAADLSEMELMKILIEKMEGNKSIQHSDEQKNLYKALVEAYEADKIILDTYGEHVILKRRRDDNDDQGERPSAGSDRGSKRQRERKEPESARALLEPATRSAGRSSTGSKSRQASASESTFAEEPVQTTSQIEEPSHLVFETGAEDQSIVQTSQHRECAQTWISELAKQADSRSSFNELLDTLIDFSNFIMNRLGVDTLTPELLAGPTYELMKGSCKSLIELEYHLEEVYKATTDQLDWINHEGQQCPHNLLHPLLLIPENQSRHTKATDYGHIKWIEDLVPHTMWIQEPINYDKHALWGVSHWGRKHQQFYGFAVNRESALDVYSKRRIIAVTDLKIVEWHNYKHLDWISDVYKEYHHPATCGRSSTGSRKLPEEAQPYQARHVPIRSEATKSVYCLFKPKRIHLSKQGQEKQIDGRKRQQFYGFAVNQESALDVYSKRRIIAVTDLKIVEWHNYKHLDWISLSNLAVEERFAFNVSLRMFTRSIVIERRAEDLQLGVESYQKRLNLTKPDTYRSDLTRREANTAYSNPRGFIYQNKDKKNRLMRIDELHKFSDGTLNDVCNALDDRLKRIRMQYLPQTIWKKGNKDRAAAMIQAIDKMLKTKRIMISLEWFVGGRVYEGDFWMLQRTI